MELNHTPHSSGVAKAGLATGVTALGVGALNMLGNGGGILGNLFGWNVCGRGYGVGYGYDPVNRFELAQESALAAKDSEIALLRANTYNDQKLLELYRYIDGKFGCVEKALCENAVRDQAYKDAFSAVVNYVNSTFYPKQIADVTVAATNTAAPVYNPVAGIFSRTGPVGF